MRNAIIAVALIASPASADIIHVTYSGNVIYGTDTLGFFGVPGASLIGDSYVTSYIFNTSIGTRSGSATVDEDLGGVGYYQPSPSLGASLTINGYSIFVSGIGAGDIEGIDFGSFSKSYDWASDYFPGITNYISNYMTDPTRSIPVSINTPFTYTATDANGGFGQGSVLYRNMTIGLQSTTVTVFNSSVPSVPEPPVWALMLFGFAFFAIKGIWPAWNRK